MKKILVVGCGKWGKILIKKLRLISKINSVLNSKVNYRSINTKDVDWVFILTPDKLHYGMVKFFLKKEINVFCEKPLADSYFKCLDLIKLSYKKKTKLYIDDIENYKKKKIKILKDNYIIRTKNDTGSIKSLLNRLSYHDMYLLYPKLKKYKKLNIKIIDSKNLLYFRLYNKSKNFNFIYSIKSNLRQHLINKQNFQNFNVDPLNKMLNTVLYGKPNYKKNHYAALFASKIIENVKRKLQ